MTTWSFSCATWRARRWDEKTDQNRDQPEPEPRRARSDRPGRPLHQGRRAGRQSSPPPPEQVTGILTCKNPRCITNQEHISDVRFYLVDAAANQYACEYCDARTRLPTATHYTPANERRNGMTTLCIETRADRL
ncbi:MAG: hypothetical protein R2912_11530 [Eubacteriales bacterium]